jgi:phage/plasmid-associated DNA primase
MATPENETPPSAFAWSLNKCLFTDTIFGKKKLVEYCDVKKVYGFIKNNLGISFQGVKKYEFICVKDKTEQEQMERFKELYNTQLKAFQTAVFLPKHKWGRVIPANDYLSLSIMRRETRHSLCDDIYMDIDMVNAQPTILFEIARQNDKKLEWVKEYVKQPKEYRELIMNHHNTTKDCAKNLPITIMMGGSYDGWIKEWDIQTNIEPTQRIGDIEHMEAELKDVINIVYATNQHIKKDVLKQDPNKWRNENEAKRGVMGLWCQSVERLLQEEVIKWLVDNKEFQIEKIVPCQDGFMVLKEVWYDGIIEDCNKVLKNKYNFDIKFINKPFDEKIDIPLFEGSKEWDEWEDLLSSKKLGDFFIEKFGDYVVKYKNCVYVYHNNRWYDETDKNKRHKLTLFISEKLYEARREDIDGDVSLKERHLSLLLKMLRNKTSSMTGMNEIMVHLLSKAKENEEDFNSKPFLLGFNNGVYDLELNEFRDYKFDDYITLTTKYDYEKVDYGNNDEEDFLSKDENGEYEYEITEEQIKLWTTNREIRDELIKVFETIHPDPEVMLLYFQTLASGLDGRAYQKLFLFNGQGGNGKGLTGSLMDAVLGDYYHQPANGILKDVEKANTPSPDMINLKNKRYINFKEVAGAVRVAMLRNLTGGGKFSGRLLNQNPEQFYMSGTFVMEFNTSPDLDGKPQQADYRRLVDILFPVNFTEDTTKIDKEIGGVIFKKANPYYETQEFLSKSKLVFLDVLLNIYQQYRDKEQNTGIIFTIPESVRLRTKDFIENQNLFQKVFSSVWEKVEVDYNDKKDIKDKTTKLSDIWDSITQSEEYKNLTYREKRQYSRDECYKWVEGLFKVEGNNKTGKKIVGFVRRCYCEDDEEDNTFNC